MREYVRRLRHAASQAGKTELVIVIADVLTAEDGLNIEIGQQDRAAETRVGTILAKEGATKKKRRIDGRPTWVSVLPVSRQQEPPPQDGRLL